MTGPKYKKDNPHLFGQSKAKEGCVVSNRSMVNENVEKAITKFSDVREVVDKRKGEPLRDTRTATDKIIVQDIIPGLGFGNLLFNGDGEEACWISEHGTRNYTDIAPPSFWDISDDGIAWDDGCEVGYTGRNAIAVKTIDPITGVKPELYQYLGRYVSDVCDGGLIGTYNSFLYLPAYTLKFRLLGIKGEWSACILSRDSTDVVGAISIRVESQIKISPKDLISEKESSIRGLGITGTKIAAILSTTWERSSFDDPLLGVVFYPEGTIANESHHLYLDAIQLTPTAYPLDFDVPLLWGNRWFLWFRKETGGLFDEVVTFDNCFGTTDGYLLPFGFFVDYIHMRVVGTEVTGTYSATARKGAHIITDGTEVLEAPHTFLGTEGNNALYWDHEHFGPDDVGNLRSGCRGLGVYGGATNLILNASLTVGDDIIIPADNIYCCISGFCIR